MSVYGSIIRYRQNGNTVLIVIKMINQSWLQKFYFQGYLICC